MCLIPALAAPPAAADEALTVGAMEHFELAEAPQAAPDGSFVDSEGKPVKLSDFRGKVVLLNLWATWCGPCVEEMPDLDKLQATLGGQAFQVVALSSDRKGTAVVLPFFARHDIQHLKVYNDKHGKLQRAFKAYGLPTSVLLDAQGRELGRLLGPADWSSPDAQRLIRHFLPKS